MLATGDFDGLLREVVVYCPILCPYAHFAASMLKLTDVSILTAPGPGFLNAQLARDGETPAGLVEKVKGNVANSRAIDDIRSLLKKPLLSLNTSEPLAHENYAHLNIVTELPSFADPLTEKDACVFFAQGKKFEFVGPLLDTQLDSGPVVEAELAEEISQAVLNKKDIILISMRSADHGDGPSGQQLGKAVCEVISGACGPGTILVPEPLVIFSIGEEASSTSWPENYRCLLLR